MIAATAANTAPMTTTTATSVSTRAAGGIRKSTRISQGTSKNATGGPATKTYPTDSRIRSRISLDVVLRWFPCRQVAPRRAHSNQASPQSSP